ncbi:MAG: hypothetical protein II816_02100 [Elusimicrobia bacterium]|nr:hypothetical protein [Elusimicrobiota bacterium]
MDKKSNLIPIVSYIYLALSTLIFVLNWCNLPTAFIGAVIILISLYFTCKNAPEIWAPQTKKQKLFVAGLFAIALLWVYLSGIGALVFQNEDHKCRNPLFELLVISDWPVVYYEYSAILTYYIGFWLPSAIFGKLCNSILAGYLFQVLWASIGIFLFFRLVLENVKKKNYIPILVFIFFSGLDILGCAFVGKTEYVVSPVGHLEWWYGRFQFSSFTTQLFWVFNQAIPAWLAVMLMYNEKNNKSLFFIYSCMLICSTFPAAGLLPFVVYWYIKNGKTYTYFKAALINIKSTIISSLTFQNIVGTLTVSAIMIPYLTGNLAAENKDAASLLASTNYIYWLFSFFFIEVGLYLLLIWIKNKRNIIYYISLVCFLVYPFITIGVTWDFCMRATIPVLLMLYLMVVKVFEDEKFKKTYKILYILLTLVFLIGVMTPLHEITRTIVFTAQGYTKINSDLSFQNFFGKTENNLFLKYFGKK